MTEWTTACPDWAERLRTGKSIIPPPIFPDQAAEALDVFKSLRIVDAPGSPTFGDACSQWVFDLVASIFGAYDPVSGRRLITEWFLLIPKKNAKSTDAAGIMMTALLVQNWRESAEFSIIAPTVEIANNSFNPARDMCLERSDEDLYAIMLVQPHVKTITNRNSGASLKVLAADSNTVGGKKSVGTLIDELWLFGKVANAENMLREATGGLASRPEGFTIYLSTQSDEPPAGVFRQKLQYARNVRDGVIVDKRFVPIIYEFPADMIASGEHRKPENFGIVNPNLGYSVDREFLDREFMKAENDGDASMRGFLAKHLNVEIGLALGSDRWAGADFWEARGDKKLTFDELLRRSEVITAGVDFGGLDDWLALSFTGREKETGIWLHWAHAWVHPIAFDRRKQEAARWKDFVRDGDLTVVERVGDEVSAVIAFIMKCEQSGLLERIGVDKYKIQEIYDGLIKEGIEEDRIVGIDQGWKLVGSISTTERRLASGKFLHGGSAMMAYCVGNAKVEVKGNNIVISKQIAGASKIDPLMATFNAVSLMALNPEPVKKKFQFFAVG